MNIDTKKIAAIFTNEKIFKSYFAAIVKSRVDI